MRVPYCFLVSLAVLQTLADDGAPSKPMPLRTLRKSELREARELRDNADRRRAEVEQKLRESQIAAKKLRFDDEDFKLFAPDINEVVRGYRDIIERFPRTEVACYAAQRLAGFLQFQGKFDDAVELLEETADDYAGTPEEANLAFAIGLMEAQGREDQVAAIGRLSRVPRGQKLFYSAQQQIVKATLKLGLDDQARTRLKALKEHFPQHAAEFDKFYEFEQQSIATGGSTYPAPKGFVLPEILEEKPQPPPDADAALSKDVIQLGRLREGPEKNAAIAALVARQDAAVAEIERQVADEDPDFGMVHHAVIALKQMNSEKSRDLLRHIARGDFRLENPNLEPWAAGNLIQLDKNVGWELLISSNEGVLTAAMNAVEGQRIDEQRLAALKKCLKHEDDLVRWRAAELLATAPRGKLANEAFDAVSGVLIAVADVPGVEEINAKIIHHGIESTRGEMNYGRYIGAPAKVEVDNEALHAFAKKHEGPTRNVMLLALARRRDASVREPILQLAQEPDAGLFRAWAVQALRDIGTANDLPLLRKLAKDDPFVRKGPLRAPHPLHATGPMYPVREAAADTIRVIEKRPAGVKARN